jgi:hypothetical protein
MSHDPQFFSGEAHDEWLKKSFNGWETGDPSAEVWENVARSLSGDVMNEDRELKQSFNNWDTGFPAAGGWDKLNEALSAGTMNRDEHLKESFDQWDAGEPSDDIWENIEDSLSVESVWNRVDGSLVAQEHRADEWIAVAHNSWSPEQEHDVWQRLNDSISLEQVWEDLGHSLDKPVRMRLPIWKIVAASVAALFISTQFADSPVNQLETATASDIYRFGQPVDSNPDQPSLTVVSGGTTLAQTSGHSVNVSEDKNSVKNNDISVSEQQQRQRIPENESQLAVTHPEAQKEEIASEKTMPEPRYDLDPQVSIVGQEEDLTILAMDPLTKRTWNTMPEQEAFSRYPIYHNKYTHWAFQVGVQGGTMQERGRGALTSTRPGLGTSVDLSYRHHIRNLQFIYALGMSQYVQRSGKWINGRFVATDQQINTLQFSSSIGYTYNRITAYGGIMLSKVLSGLEQRSAIKADVLKVYDFRPVQAGLVGGFDCRIKTFKPTGNTISLGLQYQWLPSLSGDSEDKYAIKGQKTGFDNVQGLRFQAKFAF